MNGFSCRKLLTICFFSSSFLFSAGPEHRISELEKQMLEIGAANQMGTFGAKFAPSSQSLLGCKWLFSVDVLLWKASVGKGSFALSTNQPVSRAAVYPLIGEIEDISFGMDWGFKVGAGLLTPYNNWELFLQFTRFTSGESAGSRKDLPSGFFGLTGFLDPAFSAKSEYKLSYYDLSLFLGKAYFLSSKLMTKPFMGLKSSWIKQEQQSKYVFDTSSGSLISFVSQLTDSCDFYGVGPVFGFFSQWYLDGGFSIFSDVGVSLLYGYYKCKNTYQAEESMFVEGDANTSFAKSNIQGSAHHYSPFSDFQMGLCYERSYNEDKMFFLLKLFYEAQYFFRQEDRIIVNGVLRSGPGTSLSNIQSVRFIRESEDVSFQGVVLKAEFFF